MSDEQSGPAATVDMSQGIELNGQSFYPLSRPPSVINPCAGKNDNTTCGPGCVCRGGQCYYTLLRAREMGISVPDS